MTFRTTHPINTVESHSPMEEKKKALLLELIRNKWEVSITPPSENENEYDNNFAECEDWNGDPRIILNVDEHVDMS